MSKHNIGERVRLRTEPFPGMGFEFDIVSVSDCGTAYRVLLPDCNVFPDGTVYEIDDNDIMPGGTVVQFPTLPSR
jgi:hypothetical protein